MSNQHHESSKTTGAPSGRLGQEPFLKTLLAAFILILVVAVLFHEGSKTGNNLAGEKIEEGAIKDQLKLHSDYPAKLAGYTLAKKIWKLACAHPEIDKMVITVELEGHLVDSYGKDIPGPYIMGDISLSGLEEVRKHREGYYETKKEEYYSFQLQRLKYGHLLKDSN